VRFAAQHQFVVFRKECLEKFTSLRVKEIDDWQKCHIEDSKNNPELPSKVLNPNWCDFDNNEICDPIRPLE
jgi:hypothetical protein